MIAECRDMHLNILPPDVNRCALRIRAAGRRHAFSTAWARSRAWAERRSTPFSRRAPRLARSRTFSISAGASIRASVNRRVLESLVRAGALDELGPHRAALMAALDPALAAAEQDSRDQRRRPGRPVWHGRGRTASEPSYPDDRAEWSEEQRLEGEKETLGLYLTGHPIARYAEELAANHRREHRRSQAHPGPHAGRGRAGGGVAHHADAARRPHGVCHARRPHRPAGTGGVRRPLRSATAS